MKIEVTAFPRAQQGSGASRRLRVSGRVPGIVYGAEKAAQPVEVEHKALLRNLGNEAFHASILDMAMDGEKFQVLLRDYQMHPWKKQVLHVDFQRVDKNRKIHMRVPLHFLNAEIAPGVKTGGCVVQQAMTSIDIQCLPADLPAYIEVDLKDMELNDTLHVTELALPRGVEPVAWATARRLRILCCWRGPRSTLMTARSSRPRSDVPSVPTRRWWPAAISGCR